MVACEVSSTAGHTRQTLPASEFKLQYILRQYGFTVDDDGVWRALDLEGALPPVLRLGVTGHAEVAGHTWYNIECSLCSDSSPHLRWQARWRLVHLRKFLHDPIKSSMDSKAYERHFSRTPFAHKGGMPGTTLRLAGWCRALAACINIRGCAPGILWLTLSFFHAPVPYRPAVTDPTCIASAGEQTKLALGEDLGTTYIVPEEQDHFEVNSSNVCMEEGSTSIMTMSNTSLSLPNTMCDLESSPRIIANSSMPQSQIEVLFRNHELADPQMQARCPARSHDSLMFSRSIDEQLSAVSDAQVVSQQAEHLLQQAPSDVRMTKPSPGHLDWLMGMSRAASMGDPSAIRPLAMGAPPPLVVSQSQHQPICSFEGEPVWLHIYDVSGGGVQLMNNLIRAAGSGAFHAGVEILGKEWSFGYSSSGLTGVYYCLPRANRQHVYRESICMGGTQLSDRKIEDLVYRLSEEWPGQGYQLLQRNCCHFSHALCTGLGVGAVPEWILHLAGAGATLVDGVDQAVAGAHGIAGRVVAIDELYQISSSVEAFVSKELQPEEAPLGTAVRHLWDHAMSTLVSRASK